MKTKIFFFFFFLSLFCFVFCCCFFKLKATQVRTLIVGIILSCSPSSVSPPNITKKLKKMFVLNYCQKS